MKSYSDIGLVMEGGGFRGIYTAGVLDAFLKENLFFDYAIGVSAGAAYSVSYIAGQYGRNLKVNQYVSDERYCGLKHFIKGGNFFNWDFVYKEIPSRLVPFDYEHFATSGTRMRVGMTNCRTGKAEYKDMDARSKDRFRDLLAATSSIPVISKMQEIDHEYYLDGGVSDSIPINQAIADGMERSIVILTRDASYRKEKIKFGLFFKMVYRKYPELYQSLMARNETYNRTLDQLTELEKEGKVFIIRPSKPLPISRMENNPTALSKVYHASVKEAEELIPRLKSWINQEN